MNKHIPVTDTEMVYKTHAGDGDGLEFVMSDETVDLMDDVILSDGWDLTNFKSGRNPIALFGHDSSFPIGRWKNVRVENKQLIGELELAQPGTSERINEIIGLVRQGILRAVSVGFRAIKYEPREGSDKGGYTYLKQRLMETSLVSVPANPNSLMVARSLKTSPETIDLVFAEHGAGDQIRRRELTGKHATTPRKGKGSAMSLAQRIIDVEAKLIAARDALEAFVNGSDDSNVSDADLEKNEQLRADVVRLERTHASLIENEKLLVGQIEAPTLRSRSLSTTVLSPEAPRVASPSVIPSIRKELDPIEYIVRAAAVALMAKSTGKPEDQERQRMYGDDPMTKTIMDMVTRSATYPATTILTGWAAELAQQTWTALMPLLMPASIMPRLGARGLTLAFGTAGKIWIPTRSRTPSIGGSFVGEGGAIPVRQGAFTSQFLTPKKMAVITVWTKEMQDHSQPAIEGVLREAIQQDTAVAVDSVLLDANAATVIRPAGLLNGIAAITATAITNGALAAIIGDIGALVSAITTATYGNVRSLVWLMNPTDMLRAGLISAANTGVFPFREELANKQLANIPVIDSATVPAKTLILIDAADFVVAGGGAPRMEMSDQATLHMDDAATELVASPSTVAAPQRSLFQTDSIALRMVLPLNWVQRRTGTIAWTQNVTW